jgi:hypothetical protein
VASAARIGELRLTLDQRPVMTLPLTVLHAVAEGSLAKRAADRLRRWLHAGDAEAAPQVVTLGGELH